MKHYYYLTEKGTKTSYKYIYEVENDKAIRLMLIEEIVGYSISHHLTPNKKTEIEILKGESLLNAIYQRDKIYKNYKDLKKYDKVVEVKNEPGIFYPRIYRPILPSQQSSSSIDELKNTIKDHSGRFEVFMPKEEEIMINAINQLSILTDELNSIFKTVQPTKENHSTYGHNIRNLIILVCTEVEAQLKGILKVNSVVIKNSYNTKDYVKLKEVLKLDQYKVKFNYYPSIQSFSPFKNWDINNPTRSLKWYDGYNAIKHDREGEFKKATLNNAISAISALAILIIAQYGDKISYWNERIGNYYNFQTLPSWSLLDFYLPPIEKSNWTKSSLKL